MDSFFSILINVAIFVALAIPGYCLSKGKIIKPENCGALSNLLTYVGVPFLIFSGTLQTKIDREFVKSALVSAVIFSFVLMIIYFLSLPLTAKESDFNKRAMQRFSMVFSNNGFLGLPLAMAVFAQGEVVALLIIMNLIQNVITLDLAAIMHSKDKHSFNFKKLLLSPALIAFVVGVILNLLNVTSYLPEIQTFSDHLKNLVTPISMTILGVKLGGVKIKELFLCKKTYYVSFIKLIVLPIMGVAVAFVFAKLFNISNDLILATFVAFAMPTAGLASTVADTNNGDVKGAVFYTLGSTVLSILTIPLLYLLLTLFI